MTSDSLRSFWREPLFHFVILGAALFISDAVWQKSRDKADYTIRVSPDEIQRQATIFAAENRREPSDDDLQGLLFAHVEEQVLMREAQRIGLDEDDTIIRRRLAQKMRFMINDVGDAALPDEARLKTWFEENKQEFAKAETRNFDHIFFSPQNREATIEADALAVLETGIDSDWESLGDAFIMKRSYADVPQAEVIKDFGRDFAARVFALEGHGWSAPIGSAFGLHLVRVTKTTPRDIPDFETVRGDVETLWLDEAARHGNAERLETLIEKYNVVIDE